MTTPLAVAMVTPGLPGTPTAPGGPVGPVEPFGATSKSPGFKDPSRTSLLRTVPDLRSRPVRDPSLTCWLPIRTAADAAPATPTTNTTTAHRTSLAPRPVTPMHRSPDRLRRCTTLVLAFLMEHSRTRPSHRRPRAS